MNRLYKGTMTQKVTKPAPTGNAEVTKTAPDGANTLAMVAVMLTEPDRNKRDTMRDLRIGMTEATAPDITHEGAEAEVRIDDLVYDLRKAIETRDAEIAKAAAWKAAGGPTAYLQVGESHGWTDEHHQDEDGEMIGGELIDEFECVCAPDAELEYDGDGMATDGSRRIAGWRAYWEMTPMAWKGAA